MMKMRFKKLSILLLIGLFLSTSVISGVTANPSKINIADDSDMETDDAGDVEYYAIFYGITKFKYYWYDAGYADVNALTLYELLEDQPNWKEENMKIFLNEEVTIENLTAGIQWLAEVSDENDVILFYYSGHGIQYKNNFYHSSISTYYLQKDADEGNRFNDTEMEAEFSKVKSNHMIIFFDCCWSARLTEIMRPGRVIICAGGKFFSCVADWEENLENGFLTDYACRGLQGVADKKGNNDGVVSAEEMFYYARKRVAWHSFFFHMALFFKPREIGRRKAAFPWMQIIYITDKHDGEIPMVYL